jgi:HAD superfamily hydrolase (TIGR01490 family)
LNFCISGLSDGLPGTIGAMHVLSDRPTVPVGAALPPAAHHPSRLALFDLDGTLLPVDTNQAFGRHLAQLGWVDAGDWAARNRAFLDAHHRGELDLDAFIAFCTAPWRERPQAEVDAARATFTREVIAPAIPAAAFALVRRHQQAGDLVALVTGTNDFLAEPIAALFGIDELIAVRLARDATGQPTGAIDGVPSFHVGKIARVHDWLATHGRTLTSFEQVVFYGDSVNDIPIMEKVSHPVAVNPSAALRTLADARGWPVLELFAHAD